MKNHCKITSIVLVLFLCVSMQVLNAQDDFTMRDKMKSFKKIMLMEKLNMNEEQSIKFFDRYQQQEEFIKKAYNDLDLALKNLDDLQQSGKGDYEKAIQQVFDKDFAMRKAVIDRMKAMKGILSEKQYAQYILMEHRLLDNLQKMVKQRKNRMK